MMPKYIADSDGDESEPNSPCNIPCDNNDRTKSSPSGIDHQSMSTDPSFFNSVFNEQQDAAREQPTNNQVMDLVEVEESEAAEYLSFDQGFGRVDNAQSLIEKSPWDVPSSPETIIIKPKRSAKRNVESNTRTKITRGLRRQLDDIGYRSPDDEGEPTTTCETSSKRRRTQPEIGMTGDLPSSIPTKSDSPLLLVPTARSSAREEKQYSPDRITTEISSPIQLVKPCSISIRSSGSATNVNTPREALTPLVNHLSPERPGGSAAEVLDVVQRVMSPPRSTSIAIKVDDERVVAAAATAAIIVEDSEDAEGDDPPYQDEPTSRQTTTRKTRGRPKKVVEPIPTNEENVVAAKGKKKRGRPKKSEKMDENVNKKADFEENETLKDMKPSAKVENSIQEQRMDHNSAKGAIFQDPKPTETEVDVGLQPQPQLPPPPPLPKTPTSRAEDTDYSVRKDGIKKKADAAPNSSGRQLYRVGLSKKTKIAPLLKMIRK
ncbi:hypothetical protein E4U21_000544 [Claviceps maximensis]|nr:hypothetical protein E4U21_000544 [Claviceps maximensis]